MRRKRGRQVRSHEDHTAMAFIIAVVLSLTALISLEDSFYSDPPFWKTWHFHAPTLLAGIVVFVGLLYVLQYVNDKRHALKYVEPYAPLLLFSGINIMFKLSAGWFAVIAVVSISWSVFQVRRLRYAKTSRSELTRKVSRR